MPFDANHEDPWLPDDPIMRALAASLGRWPTDEDVRRLEAQIADVVRDEIAAHAQEKNT